MIPFAALLLIATLAAWAVFCVHDRHAATIAFVALLPTYLVRFAFPIPGTGLTLPTTLLELLFLILFAAWLLTDGARRDSWAALREWALPLSLFAAGATVSVFVAPDTMASLGLWRAYIIEPILFFALFADVIGRRKRGTWALAALGTTLAVVGAIAIFQKFTGYGIPNPIWAAEETRRVTAFYGFPNAIALFAVPVVVLMAGWAIALFGRDGRSRLLGLLPSAAAVLGTLGIIFAVSEGGAIGLLAGLGLLGLFDRRIRPYALGGVIAACALIMLWAPVRDYASLLASLRDDSGSVRRIIWTETAAMLGDHQVFGAGLAGYPGRILPYHAATWIEVFQYPHNVIMNFWSEIGLLGLAGFTWIVGRFYAVAIRLMRAKDAPWLAGALIAAMTATLVHGLVDVPYFKNDLAMLFWIMVGLLEALRRTHAPDGSVVGKVKNAVVQAWPWKL